MTTSTIAAVIAPDKLMASSVPLLAVLVANKSSAESWKNIANLPGRFTDISVFLAVASTLINEIRL